MDPKHYMNLFHMESGICEGTRKKTFVDNEDLPILNSCSFFPHLLVDLFTLVMICMVSLCIVTFLFFFPIRSATEVGNSIVNTTASWQQPFYFPIVLSSNTLLGPSGKIQQWLPQKHDCPHISPHNDVICVTPRR